jgi:hypothetical protein
MDAKKLLVGVATTALGFALGLYLGKMLMKGGASTPTASAPAPTTAAEFGYDGGDDDNDY